MTPARTAWRRSSRSGSTTGAPPVRIPRLVFRRCRHLQVHPLGTVARPADAHEQQGVRGIVPLRGAEQHHVVLPEG
jgi:hypothetical protein